MIKSADMITGGDPRLTTVQECCEHNCSIDLKLHITMRHHSKFTASLGYVVCFNVQQSSTTACFNV